MRWREQNPFAVLGLRLQVYGLRVQISPRLVHCGSLVKSEEFGNPTHKKGILQLSCICFRVLFLGFGFPKNPGVKGVGDGSSEFTVWPTQKPARAISAFLWPCTETQAGDLARGIVKCIMHPKSRNEDILSWQP